MIRRFGLLRWWRYERARRSGMVIDYSLLFSPEELAVLKDASDRVKAERAR